MQLFFKVLTLPVFADEYLPDKITSLENEINHLKQEITQIKQKENEKKIY